MAITTRNSEHAAEECTDPDCPRFPCRMFHAGEEIGYRNGYAAGFADGEAAGFAAGYAAGAASAAGTG